MVDYDSLYDLGYTAGYQASPLVTYSSIIIGVFMIVCMWKIYVKAGKPGWASIVPFYNAYVTFEVAGYNGWMFLLLLVPLVNIYFAFAVIFKTAHKFGKSTGFGFGMLFLSIIFYPILAFGSAQYQK